MNRPKREGERALSLREWDMPLPGRWQVCGAVAAAAAAALMERELGLARLARDPLVLLASKF